MLVLLLVSVTVAVASLAWSAVCVHRATQRLRQDRVPLHTRRRALNTAHGRR